MSRRKRAVDALAESVAQLGAAVDRVEAATQPRRWCRECGAEMEQWHVHGDRLERMSWFELLTEARKR